MAHLLTLFKLSNRTIFQIFFELNQVNIMRFVFCLLSTLFLSSSLFSAPPFKTLVREYGHNAGVIIRASTTELALKLLYERKGKVMVETGTCRQATLAQCLGDGGSTFIFADFAARNGLTFYSVDIEPLCMEHAEAICTRDLPHTNPRFYCEDSITFLENFDGPIDFLYLDSFDYGWGNPGPCQEHQLREVKAALPHLSEKAVILLDDIDLPHRGKGGLTIPYLQANGWKLLQEHYQAVLVRK